MTTMSTSNGSAQDTTPAQQEKDQTPVCGPTDTGTASNESTYTLPSPSTLATASSLPVLDSAGKPHALSSIYSNSKDNVTRNLLIFIRHFGCSMCVQYIRHLTANLGSPADLLALNPPVRLTIIGCGDAKLIDRYKKETPCPYDLYTDPTMELYKVLDMGRTLNMGEKTPEYLDGLGTATLVLRGLFSSGKQPWNALKTGDWSQIGGEFLWVKEGSGWECNWAHRMRSTRDHAEVKELKEVLGMQ